MFDTAGENGEESAKGGNDLNFVGLEKVGNKFNVAMVRAAMVFEGDALHLECDTIKVFFEVFVNLGKEGVEVLAEVFNGSVVGHRDVNAGSIFAIGVDVGGEGASSFKACIEGGGHNGAEVGLNSVHHRDGSAVD